MVLRCLPSAEGAGPLVAVAVTIHAQERQHQLFERVSMCFAGFRKQVLRRTTFSAWAHFSHRDRAANDIETQISEMSELRLLQSMQKHEEVARQQQRLLLKELARLQGQGEGKAEAEKVEPKPAKAEGKAKGRRGKAEAEGKDIAVWCEKSQRWRDTKTGQYCRAP